MISPEDFRDAMSWLGAAVNIITTDGEHGRAGLTATAVCSVSASPPTLLVCVNKASYAWTVLQKNEVLCVNVLRASDKGVADLFAGRSSVPPQDRFDLHNWNKLATGAPVLETALVAMDCRISEIKEVGSHSICLAAVDEIYNGLPGAALIYFQRHYGTLTLPKIVA
ncbi:flavin reductase [Pusillimonas noertemannii]|uniref:Flavin reductase n=1 Tax=Pusillimonas noertemannii TaxID=305977 RepID=A0A2U1CL34_9BURK|nr:flavin reductase [Pusillimonas noertemannii]NYT69238.1 flavin reductase [Pusillimonas noertemannii]PVY61705.1 flavin reductase [Pusillimonas noertemannii]TFL09644.1 hypothetical protein CSC72_12260 [Pusillimonas noertemannii]